MEKLASKPAVSVGWTANLPEAARPMLLPHVSAPAGAMLPRSAALPARELSGLTDVCFEKHVQRMIAGKARLFLQPESSVIFSAPFPSAEDNRLHVVRTALGLLNAARTKYLKPADGSLGERIVKIERGKSGVSCACGDKTIERLKHYVPRLLGCRIPRKKRLELMRGNPIGASLFYDTQLEPGSPEDLIARLLVSSKRWIVEDEIPGAKLHGRKPCEFRLVCMFDMKKGRFVTEAHYAKIGGNDVVSNLCQGGFALGSHELLSCLTGWNYSQRQSWLDDISARACRFAQLYLDAFRSPDSLSISVDIIPQLQSPLLRPWFLEMNTWCYQLDGLKSLDRRLFERVERKRELLASEVRTLGRKQRADLSL